jgi:hypothetical protein
MLNRPKEAPLFKRGFFCGRATMYWSSFFRRVMSPFFPLILTGSPSTSGKACPAVISWSDLFGVVSVLSGERLLSSQLAKKNMVKMNDPSDGFCLSHKINLCVELQQYMMDHIP